MRRIRQYFSAHDVLFFWCRVWLGFWTKCDADFGKQLEGKLKEEGLEYETATKEEGFEYEPVAEAAV